MIASNATIETQHGCAPTYILHAHQVHFMHEKSIDIMEKSIELMANSMNTIEKSMNTLGKSMNTMEKSMNSANGNFRFKIQQSTGFFSSM